MFLQIKNVPVFLISQRKLQFSLPIIKITKVGACPHLKQRGGLGQVPYGFLKRHDPTLGPLAQSAVENEIKEKRKIFSLVYQSNLKKSKIFPLVHQSN
jgi:hypothetical protein